MYSIIYYTFLHKQLSSIMNEAERLIGVFCMYLKQLDTVGFKSFAERVKVDFVPGVTAVVGPNGSGKSNITDAIRWVLGEQSAKSLRGAKMEDIIFQGSDTRKPLNVAEVTLTLDNSDQQLPVEYDEVSVTRRVYRSGESEFLMNKQTCRLKDITDLFMDSGLGREAFSIISQGKVEEILSSKSEERRVIFEEAAGVLKYKNRKKQSEYKLAETQENLNRVEDIIYEIEGQLDPLEEQASVAKEYLAQKDRLTQHEVGLFVKEIEDFHHEWQKASETLAAKKKEAENVQFNIDTKVEELEYEKDQVRQIDDAITSLQESLLVVTQELETREGNKKIYHERLQHFQENKEKLTQELQTQKDKYEKTKQALEQERQTLQRYQKERKENQQAMKAIDQQMEQGISDIEENIESLKSDYIELLNQQAAKRNEKGSIEQQLERMEGKRSWQSSKWEGLLQERQEREQKVQTLEKEVAQLSEDCQKYATSLQQIEQNVSAEKQLYQDMQQKLYKGYQVMENLKSKKELLQELKEEFQGFYTGVKEVLKAREQHQLHGIHGAIPELLTIQDEHIEALETALGAQAQHIVVDDDQSARNAINWLKTNHKGRATFLPISSMNPRSVPHGFQQKLAENEAFIGIAADLVSYDAMYENVFRSILGNVIVARSLKDANQLAQVVQRKYRIVTLDGDVVNPGGSMSGGAKKKSNQSLFTRDRELQSIEESFPIMNEELQIMNASCSNKMKR